jgi:hypothetical protein
LHTIKQVLQNSRKKEFTPQELANALHDFGDLFYVWQGLGSFDTAILWRKLTKTVTGSIMLVD